MTQFLSFSPLLPTFWLWALLLPALVFIAFGLILQKRGAWLRLCAWGALALALSGPSLVEEQREPVESTVAIVVDRSQSQNLGSRKADTDAAIEMIRQQLAHYPQFTPRFIEANSQRDQTPSTELFKALYDGIADIPPSRLAGSILITDGQVNDIPEQQRQGDTSPVNALITGKPDEFDRQVKLVNPPRFGLTSKPLQLTVMIEDHGKTATQPQSADIHVSVNGENAHIYPTPIGQPLTIEVPLPHAGRNIIEVTTPAVDGELTTMNNQAVVMVDAVRENLRVLLVSGEPHNGERTWRDLLKSDTSVDLVHFTILRPPEKSDNTPLNQMSLIVFPTTELFVDKINDFDLVIFDRYQHYDVLPLIYYDYIAQYVNNGGALLMATGPEFAGANSLARTPLISALPALPTGKVLEKPYLPKLTQLGERHPVTRGLDGAMNGQQQWGRWMRQIDIQSPAKSMVLMQGIDNKPLMLLDHVGKGRVGMLLSDQGWLWARGFEGGGPYATLYRRMAHWLMKEPELEEESLTAEGSNQQLLITRQTMSDAAPAADITLPSGNVQTVPLTKQSEGIFTGHLTTDEIGIFHIKNGDLQTVAHLGPVNAPEYNDMVSTTEKLSPFTRLTNGTTLRLHKNDTDTAKVPAISLNNTSSNQSVLYLRPSEETRLINATNQPIFSGLLALIAIILLFSGMWYREGR